MTKTTWIVTLKTGDNQWSTITVEADTHFGAIKNAQRLLGNHPVARIA
jgi:hypothetical protein